MWAAGLPLGMPCLLFRMVVLLVRSCELFRNFVRLWVPLLSSPLPFFRSFLRLRVPLLRPPLPLLRSFLRLGVPLRSPQLLLRLRSLLCVLRILIPSRPSPGGFLRAHLRLVLTVVPAIPRNRRPAMRRARALLRIPRRLV